MLLTKFDDAIALGGWAMDLAPSNGVYRELPSCTQYHSKGMYEIPLHCIINDDIDDLFFGGRLISAFHIPFGSTRLMATCGFEAQAIEYGAAQCARKKLQQKLFFNYHNMPQVALKSVFRVHPESKILFCTSDVILKDKGGNILYELHNNYKTIVDIQCEQALLIDELHL